MDAGRIEVTNELTPDIAVVGGGLAGTFAAIAAARNGATVVLLQERPVLGGNSSSEVRVHPVGASSHGYHRDARETGLMEELFLEVRSRSYGLKQFNGQHYPMWDVVLSEKAEAEPNLTLLLNTRVVGVETTPESKPGYETRITSLVAAQQSTELVVRVTPQLVVDATGDGFVAVQAGAPFRYGREAQAEFGERWAPEEPDDVVLGSTIMFAARDVGRPVPYTPPSWAHAFPDEASLPFRPHEAIDSGYWWLEWGGRLNTISDNETIRKELHAAVFGVWDHIKNHCTVPGVRERAANMALDWIGHIPGKRESRRFEGDHLLVERDITQGLENVPRDVVAYGGWAIDLHAPDGVYSPDKPCTQPPLPDVYGIPLRSLYSRTVSNLYLAGRDISQSHVAHGSTRVMKTCAVIGEAAGTAAALSAREHLTPRDLAHSEPCLSKVQQMLLRQGAYLPLQRNSDAGDLLQGGGVEVSVSSRAELRLDRDLGWEAPGMSTAESAGLAAALEQYPEGKELPLDRARAQSVVISADRIEVLTIPLRNDGAAAVDVSLRLRQARHLRDLGPLGASERDLGAWTVTVEPGRQEIAVPVAVSVQPGLPVLVIADGADQVSWARVWQEPPGTQAASWDAELGFWRWEHGTLGFALEPVSSPYGGDQVLSGVTRPEVAANLWVSDPAASLPQSWEAVWPVARAIGAIDVTFDSQLSGWIWEGSFPLVARAYDVQVRSADDADWRTVAGSETNVQRRVAHTFEPVRADGVRVVIRETGGGGTARLVEVRAYEPAS